MNPVQPDHHGGAVRDPENLKSDYFAGLDRLAPANAGSRVDDKIRSNVLGIVRKMYGLYHDGAFHGTGPAERLGLEHGLPAERQLRNAFERFTDDLRQSWQQKLHKDELFGREADARKGRVMLDTLDQALELLTTLRERGRPDHA
jgi:hypothetical protein